jgi:hypothetical protein
MTELTTSGPYAYTRNPLYFGTFLMAVGMGCAAGEWWLTVVVAGSYLMVYVPVMLAEVDTMRGLFPEAYDRWAAEVPLFLPQFSPARGASSGGLRRFNLELYLHYREYRAALGLAVVIATLVAKIVLTQE